MRRLLPALLASALLVAACGSDDDNGAATTVAAPVDTVDTTSVPDTTEAPATTEAPPDTAPDTTPETTEAPDAAVTPAELAARGPYAVGVTTRTLPEGGLVEIWYPADESAAGGSVSYNVRDFLAPEIAALLTGDVDDSFTIEATRDAPTASDGPFPIVLFSHGASSFRTQSSHLAEHLASWGMVTASTDHPSRDLLNSLGGTAEGQPPATDQLRSMRTYLTTLGDDPVLGGALDNDRVALGGHSAGGGTIAEVALDDGILGYVSYASGLRDTVPDVPSLFMAGELDAIIAASRTAEAFEVAPAPSWLWVFEAAGHLPFSDLCAIGGGDANLIVLAEAAGLGAFIDDRLRTLATDGCEEPNRPVQEVWPGIDQAATGFYRWVFGIDAEPIGLDESAVTTGVTITSK
jgi:pimeloyl-ACP methyl ester carboxylesterase